MNTNATDCLMYDYKINCPIQTASGRTEEYARELDGTWRFGGRTFPVEQAQAANYAAWDEVSIPHTWNAGDAEDGDNYYDRTSYWYYKEFSLNEKEQGKRIYIEFLGANTKTTVYVNGRQVGETHRGGYTAFRYDITEYLSERSASYQSGQSTNCLPEQSSNHLLICVDNTLDQNIAPISADFNMYGGIYRRVYLIAVDDVHIDLDSHGSSGIYLTTGNMRSRKRPCDLGKFLLRTKLVNASDRDQTVTALTVIEGDHAPEPYRQEVAIPAHGAVDFTQECEVENPTLWMPRDTVGNAIYTASTGSAERAWSEDCNRNKTKTIDRVHKVARKNISNDENVPDVKIGYQYTVHLTLYQAGADQIIDSASERIGFRYFYADKENGFYLNGAKHPLRGVNRHSFLAGVGNALTEEDHERDMQIMLELGCNCVRLCHYPQTDYFYDLCDRYGIVVWSEIPLVNRIGEGADFTRVTKEQLTELICQQYNRPSVIFWGLENEIGNGQSQTDPLENPQLATAKKLVYELDQLAHELDTTGRYTVQAVNRNYAMNQGNADAVSHDFENNIGWKSDLIAWNIYPKWYEDPNFAGSFEEVMDRKRASDTRCMGISEYGWGANPNQHEEYPRLKGNNEDAASRVEAGGQWHPEEYQSLRNEEAISYINKNSGLWATFYWALFDFAVDARNEGGKPAQNDKGLVTADRQIKKDSYYLYKANWNHTEPFVYITSQRWNRRPAGNTYIKVYSNCREVELFIDHECRGKMENKGNGVFLAENIFLECGTHEIEVKGHAESGNSCRQNWVMEINNALEAVL